MNDKNFGTHKKPHWTEETWRKWTSWHSRITITLQRVKNALGTKNIWSCTQLHCDKDSTVTRYRDDCKVVAKFREAQKIAVSQGEIANQTCSSTQFSLEAAATAAAPTKTRCSYPPSSGRPTAYAQESDSSQSWWSSSSSASWWHGQDWHPSFSFP